jgi:DNA-binding transcriptional ArsR family regulator
MANTLQPLDALADPTRRAIFERIAKRPSSVGELAATLPVSRPAVSQHLRMLKEAQLVIDQAQGTKRIYRIDPRGLSIMRAWLDDHWGEALLAFQKFTDQEGI